MSVNGSSGAGIHRQYSGERVPGEKRRRVDSDEDLRPALVDLSKMKNASQGSASSLGLDFCGLNMRDASDRPQAQAGVEFARVLNEACDVVKKFWQEQRANLGSPIRKANSSNPLGQKTPAQLIEVRDALLLMQIQEPDVELLQACGASHSYEEEELPHFFELFSKQVASSLAAVNQQLDRME